MKYKLDHPTNYMNHESFESLLQINVYEIACSNKQKGVDFTISQFKTLITPVRKQTQRTQQTRETFAGKICQGKNGNSS